VQDPLGRGHERLRGAEPLLLDVLLQRTLRPT
jgi:hypothetical protein